MRFYREIEGAEPIEAERICTTLQHDDAGLERVDGWTHDVFEQLNIALVIDAVLQWHIERKIFPLVQASFGDVAGSREEVISEFVKGNCQDSVRPVKCFLNAIAMVDIDIDVQNSRMKSTG